MTFQDSHGLYFLSIKMKLVRPLKYFKKEFKMTKGFYISSIISDHGGEFENHVFKNFAMKTAFLIISLLLELLNKIGMLKGRIGLYKKWLEPCF